MSYSSKYNNLSYISIFKYNNLSAKKNLFPKLVQITRYVIIVLLIRYQQINFETSKWSVHDLWRTQSSALSENMGQGSRRCPKDCSAVISTCQKYVHKVQTCWTNYCRNFSYTDILTRKRLWDTSGRTTLIWR